MFVVVSYDIVDDKRRSKIAKNLEDYGTRVQYSVFECILDEVKFSELKKKLFSLIDKEEDSLRFYNICEACAKKIELLGRGEVTGEEEIYIV